MPQNPLIPPPTPEQHPQVAAAGTATPVTNNLFYELHLNKETEEWFKALSPSAFQSYQDIEKTWNHPMTQLTVTLVRDQEFRGAVMNIRNDPKWSTLMGYELVWILLIWILRAWRLQKASTALTRIWAQAWIAVVSTVGVTLLIPALVWGEDYRTALSHLLKAVFKHFLA